MQHCSWSRFYGPVISDLNPCTPLPQPHKRLPKEMNPGEGLCVQLAVQPAFLSLSRQEFLYEPEDIKI